MLSNCLESITRVHGERSGPEKITEDKRQRRNADTKYPKILLSGEE